MPQKLNLCQKDLCLWCSDSYIFLGIKSLAGDNINNSQNQGAFWNWLIYICELQNQWIMCLMYSDIFENMHWKTPILLQSVFTVLDFLGFFFFFFFFYFYYIHYYLKRNLSVFSAWCGTYYPLWCKKAFLIIKISKPILDN